MKATSGCMIEELVCLCKKVSHSGPEHIRHFQTTGPMVMVGPETLKSDE